MTARRTLLVLLVVVAVGAATWLGLRKPRPRLTLLVQGGKGPPTLVLLHGYGSSAEKWVPFTQTIQLPPRARFLFPQGPERTPPPEGPIDGRAWWRLDLASHIPPGRSIPDMSNAAPRGLKRAATLVGELLDTLDERIVLGGFSQGAMVASEVAFLSERPIRALVLLSGTLVDERSWLPAFPRRRGLPVFIAHGRSDQVLPFGVADRYRRHLESAGLAVTWYPFDGGHEIPEEVVTAMNAFLRRLDL